MDPKLEVQFQRVLGDHVAVRVTQMAEKLGGAHTDNISNSVWMAFEPGRIRLPNPALTGCPALSRMDWTHVDGIIDLMAGLVKKAFPESPNPRGAVILHVQALADRVAIVQHGEMPAGTDTKKVRRSEGRCEVVFDPDGVKLTLSGRPSSDNIHWVSSELRAKEFSEDTLRLFFDWQAAGETKRRVEREEKDGVLTVRFF